MAQIPLGLHLDARADFGSFHPAGNELVVAALRNVAPPGVFLDGPSGAGKSHLLQAFAAGNDAPYAALRAMAAPGTLAGSDRSCALALDDVDAVLGDPAWERALFALVERVVAAGGCVVASASLAARHLHFDLPDLGSRLAALPAFRLQPLDDAGKLAALRLRMTQRGLTAEDQTLRYLIEHTKRDMSSLANTLDALDRQSWETGRRLTVPFIRAYLDAVSSGSRG
ncbi:MAG: DnaA regulatory inactivator Hda [Pseudomonadota bacterium]